MDAYVPEAQTYIAARVEFDSDEQKFNVVSEYSASEDFPVRLFLLKVENQTGREINIKLTTKTSEREVIDWVDARVKDQKYKIPQRPSRFRYYGAWVFVSLDVKYLSVEVSDADPASSIKPAERELSCAIHANEIEILSNLRRAGSLQNFGDEDRTGHVYVQRDGGGRRHVFVRNERDETHFAWTRAHRDDPWRLVAGWCVAGGGSESLSVNGGEELRLHTSDVNAPASGRIFHVHDSSADVIRFIEDHDLIMSVPYAVVPGSMGRVTLENHTAQEVQVWREGEGAGADESGPAGPPDRAVTLQPRGQSGDSTWYTVPYNNGAVTYQSSIHWDQGGDPKVIIRRSGFANHPTRGRDE